MLVNLIYNLLLLLALILTSPAWVLWMLGVPKIRAGFLEKLGFWSPGFQAQLAKTPVEKRLWLHAVSVGEFNAARPLIRAFQDEGYSMIVSVTTATGYGLAKKSLPDTPVMYFPLDLPWVIRRCLKRINPLGMIMMETEIWPNLLFQARRLKIPVFMANGRLSKSSFLGYRRFRWFFAPILNRYACLLMQSSGDRDRMIELGVSPDRVLVAGNLKFDLPPIAVTEQQEALAKLFLFPANAPMVVFASSHKGEEEIFLRMVDDLRLDFPDIRVVLAPRHPERCKGVATMMTGYGSHFVLRSQLSKEHPNHPDTPIVLLDTIGELNAIFSLASVAVMGGTFVEWGGHNPLEPINAGIPVVFGPHMDNFKDITIRVLEAHAGFQVETPHEAEQIIRELLTRPEYYDHIVRNGQKLMAENRGTTRQIVQTLSSALGGRQG